MNGSLSSLEVLRQRVEQFPQSELFRFSLGKALFDAADYSGAIEQLEIAFTKKKDWMLVAILLGRAWKQQGNLDKSIEYLQIGQKLARDQNHESPLEEVTTLLEEMQRQM